MTQIGKLSGVRLPTECKLYEDDTGSRHELRFHISCSGHPGYPRVETGYIKIHKSPRRVRNKTVWTVDNVGVLRSHRHRRIGTALYEAAAQAACKRRNALASFGPRTTMSEGFWQKQLRKGRAVKVRQRDVKQPAFVLDCGHASDLSGLNLATVPLWVWALGGGALIALVALGGGRGGDSGGGGWLVPTISTAYPPPPWIRTVLKNAGSRYGVPLEVMIGVAFVESRYNPKAGSPVGAMGLMQLMPNTAASLGVSDPWDAQQNAYGGAKLLALLKRQYGSWEKTLAAYNWGQGNVNNNPTPPEWPSATRAYVANVLEVPDAIEARSVLV